MLEKQQQAFLKTEKRDKGYTRAAQLLIILGKEHAARVLEHLTEEEALAISREIANIRGVTNEEAKKVLKDFGYLVRVKDLVARGGLAKAKEMLLAAFGQEKGEDYYRKLVEKTVPHPFAFLNDLKPDVLLNLVKDESAPVISLILSHIDPLLAAKVLTALPIELKKQIVRRISGMSSIPPEVIRKTEEVLKNKIKVGGEAVTEAIDGKSALLEILRNCEIGQGKKIIDELSEGDPALAAELESKLVTLDVVYKVSDKDLQKALREISDLELAKLVKAKDERFVQRILSGVSARRAEMIRFENQGLGKMLKTDLDRSESDFLGFIRMKIEQGEITLIDEGDQYV